MKRSLYDLKRYNKFCENCGKAMILKDTELIVCGKKFDPISGEKLPPNIVRIWICPNMGAGDCDQSYFEVV